MHRGLPASWLHRVVIVTALLFGLATIVAGGRVLLGLSDPGRVVVQPLLVFNTVMGFVYLAAAVVIRRDRARGRRAAAVIALANLIALAALVGYAALGGLVAPDSFVAMTIRTGVWAAIHLALGMVPDAADDGLDGAPHGAAAS